MLPFLNSKLVDVARDENCLIVFPHTQRTGGKALRDKVLAPAFGQHRIYSKTLGTGTRDWRTVTAAELTGFRAFTGPFFFEDLDKGRPVVFVGLVRHPLYRAASLYVYCRERQTHPQHELALRTEPPEFYREAVKRNPGYFSDLQCVRLCGKPSAAHAVATVRKRYVGVGATDALQSFADLLGGAMGWAPVSLGMRVDDETRYATFISADFRDAVLQHNRQDLKLFESLTAEDSPAELRSRWRLLR